MTIQVQAFFHQPTSTLSYLIYDLNSKEAAIIDPVMDFDLHSAQVSDAFSQTQMEVIQREQLKLCWILETHAHADHLSGADFWRRETGARLGVGKGILDVQQYFGRVFNLSGLSDTGAEFDHFFTHQAEFTLGEVTGVALATPGHTSDSLSFFIDGKVFIGDTLFMPDVGSARCDFPGGSARTLYDSVQRLYQLPDETQMYVCHDYPPAHRTWGYLTSVGEQKSDNIHINRQTCVEQFVDLREARDKTLSVPALLYPGLQVNIRGGRLPEPDSHQQVYLKLPLTFV